MKTMLYPQSEVTAFHSLAHFVLSSSARGLEVIPATDIGACWLSEVTGKDESVLLTTEAAANLLLEFYMMESPTLD